MVVFVAAYISPHTEPMTRELARTEEVVFIHLMPMPEYRKRMGFSVQPKNIKIYNQYEEPERCQEIIDNAETVIFAFPSRLELLRKRVEENRLTFFCSERIFKKGIIKWLDPRTHAMCRFFRFAKDKNVHLLSIGINTAKDYRMLGFPKERMYRFGYFPDTESFVPRKNRKGEKCNVLWVGRMIGFKRPLMALKAMKPLMQQCSLKMIGDGRLWEKAKRYARRNRMPVEFLGNIPNRQVVEEMRKADILLTTSHKGEGWGAVVNEGMASGCAIVCSDSIGCIHLLPTERNAAIFKTHSLRSLRDAILFAKENVELLSAASIKTIEEDFSPIIAAQRLAKTIAVLQVDQDGDNGYTEGLCSKI